MEVLPLTRNMGGSLGTEEKTVSMWTNAERSSDRPGMTSPINA